MILQAAAFPVPTSLLVFNKCSPTTERMLQPSLYLCVLKARLSTLVLFLPSQKGRAINTSMTGSCREGAMASSIAHAVCIIVSKSHSSSLTQSADYSSLDQMPSPRSCGSNLKDTLPILQIRDGRQLFWPEVFLPIKRDMIQDLSAICFFIFKYL